MAFDEMPVDEMTRYRQNLNFGGKKEIKIPRFGPF
jgi:hypothetical protein